MATLSIDENKLLSATRPKLVAAVAALTAEIDAVADTVATLGALVSFADIHVHDNSTQQSIANGGYTKLTCFTDNGLSHGSVSPDATNDQILITTPGVYEISGTFSFRSGTANVTFYGAAFVDNVEKNWIHFTQKAATSTDVGSASFQGFIEVTTTPVAVDTRFRHSFAGPVNVTVEYANLSIKRLH